jgi:tetratricopeptide (TPR) repeat protein
LLTASFAAAQQQAPAAPVSQSATAPAPAAVKSPQPKTQAEYDAFKAASSLADAEKLEAAANDFAQRFPDSELRGYLFQMAMGQYQATNRADKALEMARAVLKYDPNNPVALLSAAQILAERTHDSDLDRDDRLAEAVTDARNALTHAANIPAPANMTPEQFAGALAQLRGTAHEVIATVRFKQGEYFDAIKEYNAAASEEKEHTDAIVWLRLAVSLDKSDDPASAMTAIDKAIAGSEPGSQIRQLAEQEKARLVKLSSAVPNAK